MLAFEFVGQVGVVVNYQMPGAGISSKLRIALVRLAEPSK